LFQQFFFTIFVNDKRPVRVIGTDLGVDFEPAWQLDVYFDVFVVFKALGEAFFNIRIIETVTFRFG
jgi:hypothetical protein